MKKSFAQQVIIGITGILVVIGFIVFYVNMFDIKPGWINNIIIALSMALFLGSLLYIFGGKPSFFIGVKLGFGMVTFMVLVKELPRFWSGVLIVLCAIVFMGIPVVKEYLYDREKNSKFPKNKKIAKAIKEQEELDEVLQDINEEFLSSIDYSNQSLLLQSSSGKFYQCIKGYNEFYFIHVGSELIGIDFDLLKTDFSDEKKYISNKKDYIIKKNDISSIKYKVDKVKNLSYDNSGSIIIYHDYKKKKKFKLLEIISKKSVKAFFQGINIDIKSKEQVNTPVIKKGKHNQKSISNLKLIFIILTFISILVSAIFLFLPFSYKILSILCMLVFISSFVLYVMYNDIISIEDDSNHKTFTKDKINIIFVLMFPCISLGLRSLLDFDLMSYKTFLVFSILIFSIILLVFFIFTNEYKNKKSAIFVIIFAALFFSPSVVVQTNYIFDSSESKIIQTEIIDKRVSESSKSPDKYLIKVIVSNGKTIELDISEEYYNSLTIGDVVDVGEKEGFLKIGYVYVIED
ncbi:hypothetical protein KHQ81_12560 [Mycoplasmatota bacterium]|nr:hypothetical protein KHQ81_12560 [Mycoplasmatota bacterium]